jgi:hypothetical protein
VVVFPIPGGPESKAALNPDPSSPLLKNLPENKCIILRNFKHLAILQAADSQSLCKESLSPTVMFWIINTMYKNF